MARKKPSEPKKSRTTQADIDRQLRTWPPRRIACWALFVLAAVVAVQHVAAHGGWRPLPFGMGWQDIFLGYPMAAVLALVGLMMLDPRPRI